jgi:hypothetical protein
MLDISSKITFSPDISLRMATLKAYCLSLYLTGDIPPLSSHTSNDRCDEDSSDSSASPRHRCRQCQSRKISLCVVTSVTPPSPMQVTNKFLGNDWCAYSGGSSGDLHKRSPVRQNLITQCRDIAFPARVEVEHDNFSVRQTSFQI